MKDVYQTRFVKTEGSTVFSSQNDYQLKLNLQQFAEEEEEEQEEEPEQKEEQPKWVTALMQSMQTISEKIGQEAPNKSKTEEVIVPKIPEKEEQEEQEEQEEEEQKESPSSKKGLLKWLMG